MQETLHFFFLLKLIIDHHFLCFKVSKERKRRSGERGEKRGEGGACVRALALPARDLVSSIALPPLCISFCSCPSHLHRFLCRSQSHQSPGLGHSLFSVLADVRPLPKEISWTSFSSCLDVCSVWVSTISLLYFLHFSKVCFVYF